MDPRIRIHAKTSWIRNTEYGTKQTEVGNGTCEVGGGPPLLPHAEHLEGVNHRTHWSAVVLQHPVQKAGIS